MSDERRDLVAQTIVEKLLKFPPEDRLEVAFAIEKEIRKEWPNSIDDAARRAKFDLTKKGVQNFVDNGFGRLQALVQVKLANELTTAVTAAKRIEDSRSGVHMDLVEGAGI